MREEKKRKGLFEVLIKNTKNALSFGKVAKPE